VNLALKILSPEKLKAKARAKVENWKREKELAGERGQKQLLSWTERPF